MRVLSYVFETLLTFSSPVTDHTFVLRCLPKSTPAQTVIEAQIFTNPRITLSECTDGFGNRLVSGFCAAAHDAFDFYASGQVAVFGPGDDPNPCHGIFLLQTPLTACTGELADFEASYAKGALAKALAGTEGEALAKARRAVCEDLVHEVYAHFDYDPGVTDVSTSAAKAFAQGRGVCQDYAQSLIAIGRKLGIPMRYVCGLLSGEGETHAWVEAHDGGTWIGLDPTNDRLVDDSYLIFSTGRDSADVPIERGVFHGNAVQSQKVDAILGTTLDSAVIRVRRWREAERKAEERAKERLEAQTQSATGDGGAVTAIGPAAPEGASASGAAVAGSEGSGQAAAGSTDADGGAAQPTPAAKVPIAIQYRGVLTGTGSGSLTSIKPETPRTSKRQQQQQQQQQ